MTNNPRKVFIVHGRNVVLRDHMIAFLRVLGLSPISWGAAARLTGTGAPYIGEALDTAFHEAQVVIVLLTGDDEVKLESENLDNDILYQPRPNVLFEAGMAFTRFPSRTILVEFENVRPCSVLEGRYRIRLSNDLSVRKSLIRTLENLECKVVWPSDEVIRNTADFSVT
ncbi:MAG TPA: TIR domain-containing protein [Ktedonobacteraceae bacterium]|nr:TIR domain-containing protein [Ktedonobacteraceae bacterium]